MSVDLRSRVLIVAPLGQDAARIHATLIKKEVAAEICANLTECCAQAAQGVGVLLVTEEALRWDQMSHLRTFFKSQPAWSEPPLIVLTSTRNRHFELLDLMAAGGNVTVLERPMHETTLLSCVRMALRARQRQYGTRDLIEAQERNVTDRKRAEEALAESNTRYRQLVEALPAAIYTCDAQGRVQLYNQAAVDLWGRTPEVGQDLWCGSWKIYRPDGTPLPLDECPMAVTIREGRPVHGVEIVIERPDGTRRNVMPSPLPILDAAGAVVGAVNMLTDITGEKRAEKMTAWLGAIVDSSDDAIISKDFNGIITSWNTGAERIFGYTAEEAIGRPITMLIPPDRLNEEPQIIERLKRGERVDHFETVRVRKDGSRLEISLTISPVKDAQGRVVGISKIARDISERKRVEEKLRESEERLQKASHAKDEFLAALSHELRNPLNPVLLLASEAASNARLPETVRADFDSIRKNVEFEVQLIDDLLDLTRIGRGKVQLDLQRVDIQTALQDAATTVQAELEQKQITLSYKFGAGQHAVMCDAVRIRQIFWNILKNAVKFTPEHGQITVETSAPPGSGTLQITVTDSGMGMTPDELKRVFDPFAQGEHAADNPHRFGGLGLGLSISRMLAELQKGSIRATSAGRGQGASFVIEFPMASGAKDQRAATAHSPIGEPAVKFNGNSGALRILLVDDHQPTRDALEFLLKRRKFDVLTAGSIAEARKVAEAGFDLLISDIGLPDGDGYELMTELQKRCGAKGIALTGYGMEEDIARSRAAGFAAHLTKPIRVQALEVALETAVRA